MLLPVVRQEFSPMKVKRANTLNNNRALLRVDFKTEDNWLSHLLLLLLLRGVYIYNCRDFENSILWSSISCFFFIFFFILFLATMEMFYYLVFGGLGVVVAAMELSKSNKDRINTSPAFSSFKNNYLLVYSLMMGTLSFPS